MKKLLRFLDLFKKYWIFLIFVFVLLVALLFFSYCSTYQIIPNLELNRVSYILISIIIGIIMGLILLPFLIGAYIESRASWLSKKEYSSIAEKNINSKNENYVENNKVNIFKFVKVDYSYFVDSYLKFAILFVIYILVGFFWYQIKFKLAIVLSIVNGVILCVGLYNGNFSREFTLKNMFILLKDFAFVFILFHISFFSHLSYYRNEYYELILIGLFLFYLLLSIFVNKLLKSQQNLFVRVAQYGLLSVFVINFYLSLNQGVGFFSFPASIGFRIVGIGNIERAIVLDRNTCEKYRVSIWNKEYTCKERNCFVAHVILNLEDLFFISKMKESDEVNEVVRLEKDEFKLITLINKYKVDNDIYLNYCKQNY